MAEDGGLEENSQTFIDNGFVVGVGRYLAAKNRKKVAKLRRKLLKFARKL